MSQRVGQRQTEASVHVVKEADEMLGTLIDLFV
ncbi:flagellar basal body rod C-terminal domain-containing protein [Lamprobacter sp.]